MLGGYKWLKYVPNSILKTGAGGGVEAPSVDDWQTADDRVRGHRVHRARARAEGYLDD